MSESDEVKTTSKSSKGKTNSKNRERHSDSSSDKISKRKSNLRDRNSKSSDSSRDKEVETISKSSNAKGSAKASTKGSAKASKKNRDSSSDKTSKSKSRSALFSNVEAQSTSEKSDESNEIDSNDTPLSYILNNNLIDTSKILYYSNIPSDGELTYETNKKSGKDSGKGSHYYPSFFIRGKKGKAVQLVSPPCKYSIVNRKEVEGEIGGSFVSISFSAIEIDSETFCSVDEFKTFFYETIYVQSLIEDAIFGEENLMDSFKHVLSSKEPLPPKKWMRSMKSEFRDKRLIFRQKFFSKFRISILEEGEWNDYKDKEDVVKYFTDLRTIKKIDFTNFKVIHNTNSKYLENVYFYNTKTDDYDRSEGRWARKYDNMDVYGDKLNISLTVICSKSGDFSELSMWWKSSISRVNILRLTPQIRSYKSNISNASRFALIEDSKPSKKSTKLANDESMSNSGDSNETTTITTITTSENKQSITRNIAADDEISSVSDSD